MQRRAFLAVVWSVGAGTWLAGCGSGRGSLTLPGGGDGGGGDGNGGGGGNGTPGGRAMGAVTGSLAKDAGGALLLVRSSEPVPAGATPLGGATLRVTGSGGEPVRSDASGRFLLQGVPAGLHSLTVEAAGLTPATTVALTVIGNATVDLGSPPVTRAAALDRARSALTAAGVADLDAVTILSPQQPLPAGVLVVPRLDAARITAAVPGAKTVARPSWFFFCDDRVGQPFAHKVRYVYVDAETGEATTEERTSWPTFNAQHFYGRAELHAASPDLVQPGRADARGAGRHAGGASAALPGLAVPRTRQENPEDGGKTYAIQIYGFTEADTNVSSSSLLGHAGIPAEIGGGGLLVTPLNTPEGVFLKDRAIAETKALVAAARSRDFLLIDINSHGNLDEDGQYFMFLPGREFTVFDSGTWSDEKEMLRPAELGLPAAGACRMLIIAGTCYAGHWKAYADQNLELPGKEVTIFCAAPADRVSYGLLEGGLGAQNAAFFREEVAREAPDADQAGLLAAAGRAVQRSIPYFNDDIAQRPQFAGDPPSFADLWSRTPTEGEDCDLSISPESAQAEVGEPVRFEVKIHDRPAGAPPVRVEVTATLGEVSGGSGSGTKTTLTRSGTVTFEPLEAGDAVITAEAFEGGGPSEESVGRVTARVTVGSGGGLVYSQIEGNVRGAGFAQAGPGQFYEVNFDGVPPLFSYDISGKIPPPAAEVNTRNCSVYLSRDIPVGVRVAVLGGAVGNPIAEVTLVETENEYDGRGELVRYRERAFQGVSGYVTLVKVEGATRTVRVEDVRMRAQDRVSGGDDLGTPVSIDGRGTFVVNGTITAAPYDDRTHKARKPR